MKLSDDPTNNNGLLTHSTGSIPGGTFDGWTLIIQGASWVEFFGGVPGGSNAEISIVSPSVLDMKWHHIAVTRSNDLFTFYTDSVATDSEGWSGSFNNLPLDLFIGRHQNWFFNGLMDEVAIYNRALTPDEIDQHYLGANYRTSYISHASLISTPITLPGDRSWDSLSLTKSEPANTVINISVLDMENNSLIQNTSASHIDLSSIAPEVSSIRLQAWFEGDGQNTPTLDSWGVEWVAKNAWRDSFTGDGKCYGGGELVADRHTVGLWHFNEGSGNVARDASGNGNNGTLQNVEEEDWVDGKYGKALEFDGQDDYVSIDYDSSLQPNNLTISFWLYPKSVNELQFLIYHRTSQATTWGAYGVELRNNGLIGFRTEGHSSQVDFSKNTVLINRWTHVTVTYDGAIKRIYLNGIFDNIASYPSGLYYGGSYQTLIGQRSDGYGKFLGIIDEVRISNISRTPDEIRQAYQAGIAIRGGQAQLSSEVYNPGVDPSCVGYWSFDEGSGNTANDGSGDGNDGTLYNMDENDWVDGVRGGALEFDGVDDYVDIGNNPSLDVVGGYFTVEVWAKWSFISNNGQPWQIVQLGGFENKMFIGVGKDADKVAFGHKNGGHPWHFDIGSGLNDGRWHQLATVKDLNGYRFYIDGIDVGLGTEGTASTYLDNNLIGTGAFNQFKGSIDEISIYDRALNASEIHAHYNFTSTRYSTNATLRSVPITIPENYTWDKFHFNRTVPNGTYLNISVHDAKTNETLTINASHNSTIDLNDINAFERHYQFFS